MLTMLLGGLWHGANWTFLIWGAMHGAALVVDHAWRRSAAFARWGERPIVRVVDWALTFHFVCLDLGVLPRAVARRGRPVSRRRVDRQRRRLDHAGDRAAADRLRRADPDRAVARARRDRRRARQPRRARFRPRSASSLLYAIVVMAPSAAAPFIYFQF